MTAAQHAKAKAAVVTLRAELDRLVAIDEQRNAHQAALAGLQYEREREVGRMQVLAEQAGLDLETFVADELDRRRAS